MIEGYLISTCSFDRDLVYMIARAISDEVRGKHNDANKAGKYNHPYGLICWAPVVNICRDRKSFTGRMHVAIANFVFNFQLVGVVVKKAMVRILTSRQSWPHSILLLCKI